MKWPESEASHSSFSDEVENAWSNTSTTHMSWIFVILNYGTATCRKTVASDQANNGQGM